MNFATALLGSTTIEKLKHVEREAVLQIGADKVTRGQLAAVGCFNFLAARRLGHVLHEQLQVPNLRYVFEQVPPAQLAVPGLGVFSLATLGAAFEALGIGGPTPLEAYEARHRPTGAREVTFHTIKHREAAEAQREAKERKQRKARRQAKAHELRVARFEQRAAG